MRIGMKRRLCLCVLRKRVQPVPRVAYGACLSVVTTNGGAGQKLPLALASAHLWPPSPFANVP